MNVVHKNLCRDMHPESVLARIALMNACFYSGDQALAFQHYEAAKKSLPAFEVLLGSDLTYFEQLHLPLLVTFCSICAAGTTVLLASADRHGEEVRFGELRLRFLQFSKGVADCDVACHREAVH